MECKDVNCGFYGFRRAGLRASTYDEVRAVCAQFGITACAWYHLDRSGAGVRESNEITLALCRQNGGVPVLRLLPPAFPLESYTKEEMERLITQERAVFRIHPGRDASPLKDWVFDWMFPLLNETGTPLLVSLQEADLGELAAFKQQFPEVPLILTNTTQWLNRQYVCFLRRFPKTYMDTANVIEYYGLENLCDVVGADKLLFGTGMPDKEPYDKFFQLLYSDLAKEQIELIAHVNFERVIERRRDV